MNRTEKGDATMGRQQQETFEEVIRGWIEREDAALDELAREFDRRVAERDKAAGTIDMPRRDDDGEDDEQDDGGDDEDSRDVPTGFQK